MATVTLPSPLFPASTAIEAAYWTDTILWNPTTPSSSFRAINGRLDEDNAAGDFMVRREHTQRGSHVRAHSVSGTADVDYFLSTFGSLNTGAIGENTPFFVPGADVKWYQPWRGTALILWTIGFANNSASSSSFTAVWLNLSNSFKGSTLRRVAQSVITTAPYTQEGARCNRFYSGHYLLDTANEGWQSAALKIAGNAPEHSRVFARHMIAIPIRRIP